MGIAGTTVTRKGRVEMDFGRALVDAGLDAHAAGLAALAVPSIRLVASVPPAAVRDPYGPPVFRRGVRPVPGLAEVVAFAISRNHKLALRADGTVAAWGANDAGMLGDGTRRDRDQPVRVVDLDDVVAVAASRLHSVALRADGTVAAWGYNHEGQLGDGTRQERSRPVQGPGPQGVVDTAASNRTTCAVTAEGELWEAGHSVLDFRPGGWRPVELAGGGDLLAVALGRHHCLALRRDGTVLAWGLTGKGALGDGTIDVDHRNVYVTEPRVVADLGEVVGVDAGDGHSVALLADGTVKAWGDNSLGQLGDGTRVDRAVPGPVLGLEQPVVALAVLEHTNLALLTDGTVLGWGSPWGLFADGSREFRTLPEPVAGLRDVAALAPGAAVLSDGSVVEWGGEVPADEPIPVDVTVGASKLGGCPDLPADAGWPDVDGRPLAFVAQVDLAALPAVPGRDLLPEAGLLSFFCADSHDLEPGRVLYTPPGARLVRLEVPDELADAMVFTAVPLRAEAHTSWPSNVSSLLEVLGLSAEDHDAYQDVYWDYIDAVAAGGAVHRLLGHPDLVQPDADDTAVLLLQVDADETAGMQWGDEGRLYYWIDPADLAHQRFDRAWLRAHSH